MLAGAGMAIVGLTGALLYVLPERMLTKLLLPLVALAAGSLLGGAFFHMIPAAIGQAADTSDLFFFVALGFSFFLALEQLLGQDGVHKERPMESRPVNYLLLGSDGLHKFTDGIIVGSAFLIDVRLGFAAWIATVAHEIPQQLGDFAVLVAGGWSRKKSLLTSFLVSLSFLAGGLATYFLADPLRLNVQYLLACGAGAFIYIASSDLVPMVNKGGSPIKNLLHLTCFLLGLVVLYLL
jgi:zinc and cadmium transporter